MSQTIPRLKNENQPANDIPEEINLSYMMLHTAQQTLTDLNKSVEELSKLVDNLKKQSEKLADNKPQ